MGEFQICPSCMLGEMHGDICNHCGKKLPDFTKQTKQLALPIYTCLNQKQYLLGKTLGIGGFGITYIAWDSINRHRVAIKELFPKQLVTRDSNGISIRVIDHNDAAFQHVKMRFREEAEMLYRFRGLPEITEVYQLLEENNTAYFVMELLDGMDMKSYLERSGRMAWQQLETLTAALLRTLQAIHSQNLIHRDISPDNIFMMRNSTVKLIDFGNTRNFVANRQPTTILKTNFAPIEQFHGVNGEEQGPWTDIYSLSVTLYYALSGKLPADAQTRLLNQKKGKKDPVVPVHQLVTDVPAYVGEALHKGMAMDRSQRFQTADEMASALFPGKKQSSGDVVQHSGPVLVCTKGMNRGVVLPLEERKPINIGRHPECALAYPVNAVGISRQQCCIQLWSGQIYIYDFGSSNGTFVDGQRIPPKQWFPVSQANIITFASEVYRIH